MNFLRRLLLCVAVLCGVVLVSLLALRKNSSIQTEVWIDASPQQVWSTLTATAEYPSWNPMISRLDGDLREGNVIAFTQGSGSQNMTFHPKILCVRPARELTWKGHIGIPGIFDAERHFYLERRGEGTDLIQSEEFTGLLAGRLTAGILRETAAQMNGMNSALKQRTELLVQRPVNIGVR
jgi:hypothetical protein